MLGGVRSHHEIFPALAPVPLLLARKLARVLGRLIPAVGAGLRLAVVGGVFNVHKGGHPGLQGGLHGRFHSSRSKRLRKRLNRVFHLAAFVDDDGVRKFVDVGNGGLGLVNHELVILHQAGFGQAGLCDLGRQGQRHIG